MMAGGGLLSLFGLGLLFGLGGRKEETPEPAPSPEADA